MFWRLGVMCGMLAVCGGAAEAGCRIALLLALDVSRSVDAQDYAIERDGLIAALADPEVVDLFLQPRDQVTVAVFEWSGRNTQQVIVDWVLVRSEADLAAISTQIATYGRNPLHLTTALGQALEFGRQKMVAAPRCTNLVMDVSGDGRSNYGMTPAEAYLQQDFGALVVNGLAIGGNEAGIADYYRAEVIRGPGAFVEVATRPADFPEAIRRKLRRELTEQVSLLLR